MNAVGSFGRPYPEAAGLRTEPTLIACGKKAMATAIKGAVVSALMLAASDFDSLGRLKKLEGGIDVYGDFPDRVLHCWNMQKRSRFATR